MSFHALHHGELPLVLPNAWDVPSALAFVRAGFPAVGTTSFGVASALGRPDGDRATGAANAELARRLGRLPVYVTVDIEDAYTDDPERAADYAAGLGGIAGVNIEDSTAGRLVPPAAHAAKVAAVKERCPGLFVNARVDTYWFGQDAEIAATVARATRYAEAGADGVFVPGVTDPDVLRALADAIPVPLNVLPVPGLSPAALGELGVRRISSGSLPYRAAMRAALTAAEAVRDGGAVPDATPYAELQAELTAHARAEDG
ncbi:isocitrate lyase/phosphoenolpyruvate mutase family protein [Actinacidiphila alni]|uniref:isocitrate lyase/PEP mutase family protein n=1 Tax=Actinacidiphila alni TaxID=380248 RepID=UPI0033DA9A03